MEPGHTPVLLAETLHLLNPEPGRLFIDATLGLGGHSEALLAAGARVLALDRDPESLALARARLQRFEPDARFRARHADYRDLLEVLAAEGTGPVDGILADLGVSSHQLLSPERGFSFAEDGPLDMRMDRSSDRPTAADLVNDLPERELMRILYEYGEEPHGRRLARAIVRERETAPIRTTAALAALIARAKPRKHSAARARLHPATLVFQALRIAVNDEAAGLDRFVGDAVSALRRGARLAVIAFHSLEDRPVKHTLRALAKGCVCPIEIPMCVCGQQPQVRLLTRRPLRPGDAECAANPRARSAHLRAAEKITDDVAPALARVA